jgi:hypothetical protein
MCAILIIIHKKQICHQELLLENLVTFWSSLKLMTAIMYVPEKKILTEGRVRMGEYYNVV